MADAWDQFKDADPYAQFADVAPTAKPAPKPAPAKPKGIVDNIAGFMANVNRGVGVGDEMAAGIKTARDVMTGKSGPNIVQTYKDELAGQRNVEDSFAAAHPMTAALGRGVGNAALMAVPAGPGAEAFAGSGMMTNAARGATVAGLTGAAYAAADRGSIGQRMTGAAQAADPTENPLTFALGAAGGALATPRAPKAKAPAAPTLEDLTTQKNAAYKAVEDSGAKVPSEDFTALTENMANAMDKEGFNAGLHPKAAAMMERIGKSDRGAGGASPTLAQLDQLRQQIGRDVASSPDAGERRMGTIMRNQIDDYISGLPEGNTLTTARDLNTRIEKLRSLDNLDEAAADRASGTGSGGNINNATRQNVIRFKNNTGNLTADERAAAQKVIDGTMTGNALRQVGKLSPGGNGLMTAGHIAALVPSGGTSGVVALGGAVAKAASDAITARNVGALRSLIASGGQAAQEVSRQLADPVYADLRRQLANDLAVQAGVQGTARRGSVTASVEGHPEYGVGVSSR